MNGEKTFYPNQAIDLTTTQFELLWNLDKRSGRVAPREELCEALYR